MTPPATSTAWAARESFRRSAIGGIIRPGRSFRADRSGSKGDLLELDAYRGEVVFLRDARREAFELVEERSQHVDRGLGAFGLEHGFDAPDPEFLAGGVLPLLDPVRVEEQDVAGLDLDHFGSQLRVEDVRLGHA